MEGNVQFEPIESAPVETEPVDRETQTVELEPTNPEDVAFGLDPKEDYSDIDEITARIKLRKQEAIRRKNRARKKRIILLGIIVFTIAMFIFSISSFFTVDSIDVRGNVYFTADEVINMAHAAPGKNLIYHPDKKNIVNYLEQNPYIKKAKVSRHFPSTLVITIDERKQLGAIKYDKDYLIVDGEGILLRRTHTTPKLTLIEGIVVKKITLGEEIGVKDRELLNQALAILNKMSKKDLYFVRLDMTNMYILAYIYDSLVCKGTYKQLVTAIDNNRLHIVLDRLFDDNIKRGTITFSDEGYVSFIPTI